MMEAHGLLPFSAWRRPTLLGMLWLGLLLIGGTGCREEPEDYRVPGRLKIQGGIPGFPGTEVFPPNYVLYDVDFPTTLRLDLNEPAAADEISVTFFPLATRDCTKRTSSTAGILWLDDYQPADGVWMQRILIDGPRFVRPWLQEFRARDVSVLEVGFVDAQVYHNRPTGPKLLNTLMLFYESETVTDVQSARDLFSHPASSAVLANFDLSEGSQQRAMRIVDQLQYGAFYTMAAIVDSNDDGLYDPEVDWWGATRTFGTPGWNPVFVPAVYNSLEEPISRLEVELLPPPVR